jgi:hypothetical protein
LAVADHRGAGSDAPLEPTAEDVAAHLGGLLGPASTRVVLEEPFPGLAPAMFDRVLRALAGQAAHRLVVYVTELAPTDQGTCPSPGYRAALSG